MDRRKTVLRRILILISAPILRRELASGVRFHGCRCLCAFAGRTARANLYRVCDLTTRLWRCSIYPRARSTPGCMRGRAQGTTKPSGRADVPNETWTTILENGSRSVRRLAADSHEARSSDDSRSLRRAEDQSLISMAACEQGRPVLV